MFHMCASFGDLLVASQSRDPVTRPYWVHTPKLFFTLFHTLTLHDSHLNIGFLNVELQENWHEIKPTKWLIKFNLTMSFPMLFPFLIYLYLHHIFTIHFYLTSLLFWHLLPFTSEEDGGRNLLSCNLHCLGHFLINAADKAVVYHLMRMQQVTLG